MNSYYNTTNLRGVPLQAYISHATKQDSKVLEFFLHNQHVHVTCEDIHNMVMPEAPITSARRAMSNLQKMGYVEKCDYLVDGQYGKPINTWRFVPQDLK